MGSTYKATLENYCKKLEADIELFKLKKHCDAKLSVLRCTLKRLN